MSLDEYPRPQCRRPEYLSLNGEWEFCVQQSPSVPDTFSMTIQVPYSPEAELSGVCRQTLPGEYLFYRREILLPEEYLSKRLLLHFGASDRQTEVFVNGEKVIEHCCGYLPFTADLGTDPERKTISILVRISDDTDLSYHTRGKQKIRRGGIWYTPQSGLWQTVWLEPVPETYIQNVRIEPDFDSSSVHISADLSGEAAAEAVFEGVSYPLPARIPVADPVPWTPDNPKLYSFSVHCGEDRVESYFALRKFSVAPDDKGIPRLMLNNRVLFHQGLLDQGYWQSGLYTPPSDEAMVSDILTAKSMGFNVLRKHIKVEPLRWYYHCDRLGMIVWQDMVNGGGRYSFFTTVLPLFTGIHLPDRLYRLFARQDMEGRREFEDELRRMILHLYNCPCIGLWTIFNEGWGQFDAARLLQLVKALDNTRPVDPASGWHDQGVGDVVSSHVYFRKYRFRKDRYGRCVVLSEFGGYNLRIPGHCYNERNFGYRVYRSAERLRSALEKLYREEIFPAVDKGLSGAVYTQLSDVEDELNGLITYDREVVKIPPEEMRAILCAPITEKAPDDDSLSQVAR